MKTLQTIIRLCTTLIRTHINALLMLLSIIVIVSCNLPQNNTIQKSVQKQTELVVTDTIIEIDEQPVKEQNEIVIADTPVEKDQKIANDIFELSINKTLITRAADTTDLGVDINLSEQKDIIYFILFGSVKNVSASAIPFSSMVNVGLIFDDKYEYDVSLAPSNLSNLIPLKTETFVWYASVPYEVMSSTTDYKFRWEILSNTEPNQLQAKYTFSGKNSQYMSAENIDNFHIFTEVIELIISELQSSEKIFVSLSVDEKNKQLVIHPTYDDDFSVQIANGVRSDFGENSIEIHPWLYLDYGKYKLHYGFGEIELQIYITSHIWAHIETLSLSSDTKSVELQNNPFKWINKMGGTNQQFFYTSDLSNLKTIFENNPVINVGYKNTSSDQIIVGNTNLIDDDKDSIDNLIELYTKCDTILNK